MPVFHCYRSAEHERMTGRVVIYLGTDGREIACTCVCGSREWGEAEYQWPDRVYLGTATAFLRGEVTDRAQDETYRSFMEYSDDPATSLARISKAIAFCKLQQAGVDAGVAVRAAAQSES